MSSAVFFALGHQEEPAGHESRYVQTWGQAHREWSQCGRPWAPHLWKRALVELNRKKKTFNTVSKKTAYCSQGHVCPCPLLTHFVQGRSTGCNSQLLPTLWTAEASDPLLALLGPWRHAHAEHQQWYWPKKTSIYKQIKIHCLSTSAAFGSFKVNWPCFLHVAGDLTCALVEAAVIRGSARHPSFAAVPWSAVLDPLLDTPWGFHECCRWTHQPQA